MFRWNPNVPLDLTLEGTFHGKPTVMKAKARTMDLTVEVDNSLAWAPNQYATISMQLIPDSEGRYGVVTEKEDMVKRTAQVRTDVVSPRTVEEARKKAGVSKDCEFDFDFVEDDEGLPASYLITFTWED
jgi:hypothetical protein